MLLEGRSIAIIEDDPIMGESLWQALSLEGAEVSWWRDGQAARHGLITQKPDAVICDIRLPDTSGADLFRLACTNQRLPPFLFMTAYGQIDEAVGLLRAGAGDYVTKPFQIDALIERLDALLTARRDPEANGVLGVSAAMQHVETMLRRVADQHSTILLTGPTGCGKEVAASFLHTISSRSEAPFVAVNCAALPADLMESELFGHERGAFTGAHAQHRGFADRSGSGILFLDEIGELPANLQAKLLRLLEQRVFTRVGGEKELPFKARVVCASNRDLAEAAAAGRFRDDLYHRINTIEIRIPPLADRRKDIEPLLAHFFNAFVQLSSTGLHGFASTTVELAHAHDWPGNVRELRNRVERAVALAPGEWIMPSDMFPDMTSGTRGKASDEFMKLADVRALAERRQIERALSETEGNSTEAAKLLGISRTTLWEKMRKHRIGEIS